MNGKVVFIPYCSSAKFDPIQNTPSALSPESVFLNCYVTPGSIDRSDGYPEQGSYDFIAWN
jgi:hypothetical protein